VTTQYWGGLGGFPAIHWFVLGQLAASIVVAFLIESNQEVLQFLNSLQLRILFALIIAVCSSTATLCVDLADPFRGKFSVITAVEQVADLERVLARDVAACDDGAGGWRARDALRFHALTSPLYGAPVRALGDAASYASRRVVAPAVRRARALRRRLGPRGGDGGARRP